MKNNKSQVWCPWWRDFVYSAHASSFRGWSSPSAPCLIFMIILKLPDENHLPGYTSNACSAGRRILQFLFWRIWSPALSVKWGALAQVSILKSKVDHLVRAKAYFANISKYQPVPKNGPLLFREEIVFIDHNESNGTINALRLGNSFIVIISSPWSRLPRSPLCTLYNCQGAYKAHWVTEGNIMSYSKDIACIDVQRRSSLLFGDKSHFWMFWRGRMLFALQYTIWPFWWELWNERTKCLSHLQWNYSRFIQNLNSDTTHLCSTMWRQIPKSCTSWPETHSLIMIRSVMLHCFNLQLLL